MALTHETTKVKLINHKLKQWPCVKGNTLFHICNELLKYFTKVLEVI